MIGNQPSILLESTPSDLEIGLSPKGLILKDWVDRGKRSTAIASLIYSAGNWPEENNLWRSLIRLQSKVEPYLAQMNLLTHEKSREVALQLAVHETVKDYSFQFGSSLGDDESPLERVLECQEYFNNLLQPWFMSKAVIEFELWLRTQRC